MTTRTPQEIAREMVARWLGTLAGRYIAPPVSHNDDLCQRIADAIEAERAQSARLREALLLAREWCMGRGFSARVQIALQRWIDDGMTGPLPELPEYARRDHAALSDKEGNHG